MRRESRSAIGFNLAKGVIVAEVILIGVAYMGWRKINHDQSKSGEWIAEGVLMQDHTAIFS